MMQYDANHVANPGTASSYQLTKYVSGGGGPIADARGMPIGESELEGFRQCVVESGSSGMHTFSFETDIDTQDLIHGVREPAKQHLDGRYVIGIHTDSDRNHIHIGECGNFDDLTMSAGDVRGFATDVADSLGVTYG